MNVRKSLKIWIALTALMIIASGTTAIAADSTLSVTATSLGKIVVNGKGMTAYFYELDKANSGVSACAGGCTANWPAIIATTKRVTVAGVKGRITVLARTKQIAINGRPIYTFAGDTAKGSTNGQGLGGVWYAISAAGIELNPAHLAKASAPTEVPMPTVTPEITKSPVPSTTPAPATSASAYSNSNY